ncbi:hypothetical protein BOO86_01025 [Mycobacterium sp. CBMA 234]|uniref:hypothetical protein n=1 Tax=Mycolicibacterium sp. CBMA 234 TaxID=1918495 RepID=UPI0012DE7DBC|nr:hypothetical protein [Mycolicibacterium sp. CBMA 234]MUL63030.1 hypothetical protein [Mycolicibacterium sp. CBMA 234]
MSNTSAVAKRTAIVMATMAALGMGFGSGLASATPSHHHDTVSDIHQGQRDIREGFMDLRQGRFLAGQADIATGQLAIAEGFGDFFFHR